MPPSSNHIGIVTAGDLKVGDSVAERDRYLFEVVRIERTAKMTTLYLASDFSLTSRFHKDKGGVAKTLLSSSKVYCVRKDINKVAA